MAFKTVVAKVTTAGANGSATGDFTFGLPAGRLHAVEVDYHASAPNTTVVKFQEKTPEMKDLIVFPAGNTDVPMQAFLQLAKEAEAAGTNVPNTDSPNRVPVPIGGGSYNVNVTLSNALTDAVIVKILMEV